MTNATRTKMHEAGYRAFKQDRLQIPAHCDSFMEAIEGAKVGDGSCEKIAKAWNAGYEKGVDENLKKQFPEMYA